MLRIQERTGGPAAKCDICDQEFANSEELMRHQEQVHPMDEDEMPDMAPETREEPAEQRR
ncbi:MAG TPA: C2H2-type zinc finger protein [Candidatus Micrarchaeaceae archaeon]|nr:C2H2-type zinc finger protein [Candidatus Micrarchaeaceae archaeon]